MTVTSCEFAKVTREFRGKSRELLDTVIPALHSSSCSFLPLFFFLSFPWLSHSPIMFIFFTPMFNFRLSWSFSSVSSYPPSCPSPFPSSRLLTLRHHPFINFWTPTRSHWSASTKVCFVCHVLQRRTAERSAQCLLSFPRARPLPDNGMVSHFSKK